MVALIVTRDTRTLRGSLFCNIWQQFLQNRCFENVTLFLACLQNAFTKHISYVSRLNFTETTSFNLVLPLCSLRHWNRWNDSFVYLFCLISGPYLRESSRTFIIWLWLLLGQVTTRLLCASNVDNVILLFIEIANKIIFYQRCFFLVSRAFVLWRRHSDLYG